MNMNGYFAVQMSDPIIPIQHKKPCEDCAVIKGLYREISDSLLNESEPLRTECSKRWWCHKGGRCMGHWLRLRNVSERTSES